MEHLALLCFRMCYREDWGIFPIVGDESGRKVIHSSCLWIWVPELKLE